MGDILAEGASDIESIVDFPVAAALRIHAEQDNIHCRPDGQGSPGHLPLCATAISCLEAIHRLP